MSKLKNKIKKRAKILLTVFLSFVVLFINCGPAMASYMDTTTKGNKKEQQLMKKIEIIHKAYPKQTDEAALYATLVHRGYLADYINDAYDPNFDESAFANNWNQFNADFKSIFDNPLGLVDAGKLFDIFMTVAGSTAECVVEAVTGNTDTTETYNSGGSGPLSLECMLTKVINNYAKNVSHTSDSGLADQIKQPQGIDLLTAAAIVMIDSSGWFGNYSDENYKKALAGDGLVGSFLDDNDPIQKLGAIAVNSLFCAAGAIDYEQKDEIITQKYGAIRFCYSKRIRYIGSRC